MIALGASASIDLPPGSYEEGAEALNASVIPFYGLRVQDAATSYQVNFILTIER
jgi:hypothetical protein